MPCLPDRGPFLAGRDLVQSKGLHERITNRFQSDTEFGTVQLRITGPREPGEYRVIAETDPRVFLGDDAYPVATARIEVGFELGGRNGRDCYWFNWIEPDRDLLLGGTRTEIIELWDRFTFRWTRTTPPSATDQRRSSTNIRWQSSKLD